MPKNPLIKVVLADDEQLARKAVKIYVESATDFHIVADCADGLEAIDAINKLRPDVVFLDIEMPEISGMNLIQHIEPPLPHIVFITAYHQYAVEAFEASAIDYILKPFDRKRFEKMITKVRQAVMDHDSKSISMETLLAAIEDLKIHENGQYLRKVVVKRKSKINFVPVNEILWAESAGSISKIYTAKGMEITNQSIKQLEESLDPAMHMRIHKSHLINLDEIKSIEPYFHGEYIVTMSDGKDLKLSRGYKGRLDRIIHQYQR